MWGRRVLLETMALGAANREYRVTVRGLRGR